MSQELQDLYRNADRVRGSFGGDEQRAVTFFHDYVGFVQQAAPLKPDMKLLDVGCGAGWSSYLFAKTGYQTTGIDLNEAAFEPPDAEGLTLVEGSALELDFADAAFNVVAAYQTLEHIPNPQLALREMLRVCKPGGVVCIVGPNLLSILQSFKSPFYDVWKNRPVRRVFRRERGMPRHPWGNTVFEALPMIPLNFARIAGKVAMPQATFTMRRPDRVPPFYADNDACYMCNPIDLSKFFAQNNATLIQNGAYGRPAWTSLIMSGTWIAARKND